MERDAQAIEVRRTPPATAGNRPRTLDAELRTVEVVWTTGAEIRRRGRLPDGTWGDYLEQLSLEPGHVDLARMNGGSAPLLNSHNNWDLGDVIGFVESATVNGKQGRAVIRFSSRAEVEPIFRDVADGVLRNISVGYQVTGWEWQVGDGTTLPRARAIAWEPMELSLEHFPADRNLFPIHRMVRT